MYSHPQMFQSHESATVNYTSPRQVLAHSTSHINVSNDRSQPYKVDYQIPVMEVK